MKPETETVPKQPRRRRRQESQAEPGFQRPSARQRWRSVAKQCGRPHRTARSAQGARMEISPSKEEEANRGVWVGVRDARRDAVAAGWSHSLEMPRRAPYLPW